MIKLDEADRVFEAAKRLHDERRRYQKMLDKEFALNSDWQNTSRKQRSKASVNCNWQANHVRKVMHDMHIAVVETGLANPFEDDYYGATTVRPSAFHEYEVIRKKPGTPQ
jgi:hypothetical protein